MPTPLAQQLISYWVPNSRLLTCAESPTIPKTMAVTEFFPSFSRVCLRPHHHFVALLDDGVGGPLVDDHNGMLQECVP